MKEGGSKGGRERENRREGKRGGGRERKGRTERGVSSLVKLNRK